MCAVLPKVLGLVKSNLIQASMLRMPGICIAEKLGLLKRYYVVLNLYPCRGILVGSDASTAVVYPRVKV